MRFASITVCLVIPMLHTASAAEPMPPMLKGAFATFDTPLPASAEAWERQKPELRRRLWRLLGDVPPLLTPKPTIDGRDARDGYTVERFSFDNGVGDTVYGYLLIPANPKGPRPAILYHHYHGGNYQQGKDELFRPAFAQWGDLTINTGEELVRKGYVVLCIDAYGFGQRRWQGPAGDKEEGSKTEASLFKTFLWQGKTLWGMMVRDDLLALNYLVTRPEVDPQRIAAMGMSMGATRTWWAAALDDRIKASVSVACLTRYQDLIAEGSVDFHGVYYYVPGVLAEKIDTEAICGLIAPRAHLTLTGALDAGSPARGVRTINAFQQQLYSLYEKPDRFRGLLYDDLGHTYTQQMWQETIDWLAKQL
jgi:dienelactone hydrolase